MWHRRLDGTQKSSGHFQEQKNRFSLPGTEPRFLSHPPHSLVIIQTMLSKLFSKTKCKPVNIFQLLIATCHTVVWNDTVLWKWKNKRYIHQTRLTCRVWSNEIYQKGIENWTRTLFTQNFNGMGINGLQFWALITCTMYKVPMKRLM